MCYNHTIVAVQLANPELHGYDNIVSRSQTASSSFIFGWEESSNIKEEKRSGYARLVETNLIRAR